MTRRESYSRKKVEQLWRTATREGWSYEKYCTHHRALIRGGQVKTYEVWQASDDDLNEFLQVGDCVDEELKMYILETLPPACMSSRCIQLGEPSRHDEQGRPMFITLEREGADWIYTGIKATPVSEVCLYV